MKNFYSFIYSFIDYLMSLLVFSIFIMPYFFLLLKSWLPFVLSTDLFWQVDSRFLLFLPSVCSHRLYPLSVQNMSNTFLFLCMSCNFLLETGYTSSLPHLKACHYYLLVWFFRDWFDYLEVSLPFFLPPPSYSPLHQNINTVLSF